MNAKSRAILPGLGIGILFNLAVYGFLGSIYLAPDGVGYLSYLPSLFGERTLSFATSYDHFRMPIPPAITPTGWMANIWSFGSAFFWMPFYKTADVILSSNGMRAAIPWSGPYLPLVNFASMVFGVLAMLFLLKSLSLLGMKKGHFWIAGATFVGTPLFFYSIFSGTVSHAATAMASGLMIWYWLRTVDEPMTPRTAALRWFTLGLLSGLAAMVRTQEALILFAPLCEWARKFKQTPPARAALLQDGGWFLFGCLAGFSPQALVWKFLYGSFFYAPASFNLAWAHFELFPCLFSSFHGLFSWTPFFLLAFIGLGWESVRGNWKATALGSILTGQLILNSFSVAWWEGFSFGLRQMTGTAVIAGIGVCFLWQRFSEPPTPGSMWVKRFVAALIGLTGTWTFMLAFQGQMGNLDLLFDVGARGLLKSVMQGSALLTKLRTHWATGSAGELFGWLLLIEGIVTTWFLRLTREPVKQKKPFAYTVSPILLWTFLPWIVIANLLIIRSSGGSKPSWPPPAPLDARDLANFFVGQSYEVRALYHHQRNELAESADYFARAEKTMPDTPATRPWREQLEQFKQQGRP